MTDSLLQQARAENDELRARLHELEDTIAAIRNGDVDAFLGTNDARLYSLNSADKSYRTLVEQMYEGALVLSQEGTILYVNQRMVSLLATSSAELIGRNFCHSVSLRDHGRFSNFLNTAITRPERGEFLLRGGMEGEVPVLISLSSVSNGEETLAMSSESVLCAVVFDLSERRQMEVQLRQSQKMEAVGQLTGGLAHDFNNLLQAIHGNLGLIQRLPDNVEKVRQWALSASKTVERGAKLTAQLLAFSRTQKIELSVLAVPSLIKGMADLIERTIGSNVRIVFDLPDEQPPVVADPTQLELAVLNLAINARDAMPEGGELCIASSMVVMSDDAELPSDRYIELRVSDTGTGMSAETQLRAFEPFFTTKGVGAGTGLGLAQVFGIARQAGGTVRIASKLGVGTSISIYLRCSTESLSKATANASSASAYELATTRILVVDDDTDVRTFLAESLDLLGFRPSVASDAQTALTMLDEAEMDAVLLDYAMPHINGGELAQLIRARKPMVPIVFVTGFADGLDLSAITGPAPVILKKPFSIDDLSDAVTRVMTVPQ